jgi:hypothetical protein
VGFQGLHCCSDGTVGGVVLVVLCKLSAERVLAASDAGKCDWDRVGV